jgi:tRNA pseudouridine synthase 10
MEDLEALLEGDPRVVKAVQAEIGRHRLCDDCLGRQLGKVDHGTNLERGRIMRETVEPRSEPVRPENCHLCEGLVDEYDDLAAEVQHALEDYEWNTFLVGTKAPKRVTQLEVDLLRLFPSVWIESFKAEVNREVGRRVEAATGKEAEFETPDMTVLVDPEFNTTEVQVRSVYVYGRYRKLARGIPQTRWPCRKCKGRGCEACDGTGQQYETSVEQLIASPFMEALEGKEHAFHGAGREDIDARMLGRGRPFVLEIRTPKRRSWDADEMAKRINEHALGKAEVTELRPSTKAEVVTLKEANWEKTYLISFDVEGGATNEELAGIAGTLSGTVVRQRTPQRVAHRRADKERPRMVKHLALVDLDGATAKVEVRGESGIYVKELIHGDRGRTQPSMAELLGRPCSVVELDVLQVHDADDDRGE